MSNISRKMRDQLNDLSVEIFGVSSKWQKILNRGKVLDRYVVDEKATNERRRQALELKNAGVNSDEIEAALGGEVKRAVFRSYTPEEVLTALLQMKDTKDYSALPPEEGAKKAARQFLNKSLSVDINLVLDEKDKPHFDNLMNDVPKEQADQLLKVVSNENSKKAYNFDAIKFLEFFLEEKANGAA